MRKIDILRSFVIFILLTSLLFTKPTDPIVINLITTNDLHGVIAEQWATFMNPEYPPKILGGSAIYKYVQDLRQEITTRNEGLLILDAGNFFQGHPLGLYDGGQTMIQWMNKMGYSALTPGRYDFILGAENLNRLAEMAEFPFLTGNLECRNCPLGSENIKPFIIEEIQGVKVGILGIVTSGIVETVLAENIPGIFPETEVKTLEKWIPILKNEGAEVIIVLASTGVPWDREEVYEQFRDSLETTPSWNPAESHLNSMEMGYYAHGADVIISGGESKGYPQPWYDPNSHVFIFQNYGNGTEFGHIRLLVDRKSHRFIGYETAVDRRVAQTVLADDFSPDFDIHKWIETRSKHAINQTYMQPNWQSVTGQPVNCTASAPEFSQNNWSIPSVNRDDEIEIITWNCEFFPTNDDATIAVLSEVINDLDADIIAFQEIRFTGWFSKLMNELPQYGFIVSRQSSFMDQAIIYKKEMFRLMRQVELFAENDYNFAGRPPLRGDFQYRCGDTILNFSVINLHMKCCDSGLKRRQKAVQMLHEYLAGELEKGPANFIVLGDWNDDLKDADNAHGFQPFFRDDRFFFANQKIVHDLTQASYPKEPYVSFLDHILVTKTLIQNSTELRVRTLPMGEYMGGYDIYERYISDHLPVMIGFSPFVE